MKLSVRRVDLRSDRGELLDILKRNLTDLDHEKRFEWLYHDNPAGPAWSWFVCAGEDERAVGAATVFPRFFWVGGREVRGGQVGDFAVDAGYRSLGPALRLQRATLELVDRGELRFCYDCPPHDRGMTTFQRLGLDALCRLRRFSRLERVDHVVRRAPGGVVVQTPLRLVGNGLLWLRSRARARTEDVLVERHSGAFADEFDELDRAVVSADNAVRSRRRAEDLDWRYRRDPLNDYRVLTARRAGQLAGFAVCSESVDTMNLIDLVGLSEPARMALLNAVSSEARARRKVSVQTCIVEPSSDAVFARKAGFIPRGWADRVVVYPSVRGGTSDGPLSAPWSLSYVDTIA